MDESLAEQVRQRAHFACEYCRVSQRFYPTIHFPVDHIIARQHGGPTAMHNLALSCLHCNSHKGPNIAGIIVDPENWTTS
jgi:5-methylcytosine-specific restriction endonuclease McrA